MPYGYIIIFGAIALTLHYIYATTASLLSKALVLAVLGACLGCIFWLHRYTLAASFIMVGLAVYIWIYGIIAQARSSDRQDLH